MTTRGMIEDSIQDLGSWAEQMDRAAESCRYLLAAQGDGRSRELARQRLILAERLAGEFRAEAAAWSLLLVEQPYRVS